MVANVAEIGIERFRNLVWASSFIGVMKDSEDAAAIRVANDRNAIPGRGLWPFSVGQLTVWLPRRTAVVGIPFLSCRHAGSNCFRWWSREDRRAIKPFAPLGRLGPGGPCGKLGEGVRRGSVVGASRLALAGAGCRDVEFCQDVLARLRNKAVSFFQRMDLSPLRLQAGGVVQGRLAEPGQNAPQHLRGRGQLDRAPSL